MNRRLEFDHPITAVDRVLCDNESDLELLHLKCDLNEDGSTPLQAKLAISWTSAVNTLVNTKAEIPGWELVEVQRKVAREWQDHLDAFQIVDTPDWL